MTSDEPARAGSFFGRRKGKALRSLQQQRLDEVLPALRVPDPSAGTLDPFALFDGALREIRLEIGFGGGEHLARVARENPDVGFIGCEPFVNGVAKLMAALDEAGTRNVRVWDRDAADLLDALPPASLSAVYVLYPDPWPKRRQRKRRFLGDRNLSRLTRAMAPGAELRFATDIDDYAGSVLAQIPGRRDLVWTAEKADDWRRPWTGWEPTRYEAKARREGRGSAYITLRRTAD